MIKYLFVVLGFIFLQGCKKFTAVDFPINQVGSEDVFKTDANAISAVAGIYGEIMGNPNQIANGALTFNAGLSADELRYYTPDYREEFFNNELSQQSHPFISAQLWAPAYKMIYVANLSIEKLRASTGLSTAVRNRLLGECLYIRSFHYFILVNLFGDVPLCTSSDYRVNGVMAISAVAAVYAQITEDLTEAAGLLPEAYALAERSVPNKWAAKALLAKCFLYQEKWDAALAAAKDVLEAGTYQLEPNLDDVFLRGSRESLWQMASVIPTRNSWEGFYMVPASATAVPTYLATPALLNHFEAGDLRKVQWLRKRSYAGSDVYSINKYKVRQSASITEYQVVMRLAEVFLIRAEALLNTNNVTGAILDINVLRNRAGLAPVNVNVGADSCRTLLVRERRSELFAEWGNRWFDLKRWNKANEVLGALKSATWQHTDVLYPIPQTQIQLNGNLVQNPGY